MTAVGRRTAPGTTGSAPVAPRGLAWLYLLCGGTGLVAAFVLTLEKLASLRNPGYVPTCSLNPTISCGSVMDSPQAAVFGFPNPLIGIIAFAVVATLGVVLLSGYTPPGWLRWGMQLGTTGGALFVHWLIYASLYDIHALCPYCMVVWAVTIPLFWYTTLHNFDRERLPAAAARVTGVLTRYHTTVLAVWYVAVVGLILQAFWDYWTSLL